MPIHGRQYKNFVCLSNLNYSQRNLTLDKAKRVNDDSPKPDTVIASEV